MNTTMPAERHFRAFARRAVDLPAVLTPASGSAYPARLLDLGLGGGKIEIAQPLDVGVAVTLQITAPNLWDPLVLQARVAWSRAVSPSDTVAGLAVMGLAFTAEEDSALSSLVELLYAQRTE